MEILPGAGMHGPQFPAQRQADELVQAETIGRFVGDREYLLGNAVPFKSLDDTSDIGMLVVVFRQ